MSCLINSGWKLNCPKLSSGIRKIYVIPFNYVSSYTISADNIITAVNTVNSNPFYVFEVPSQTAEFVQKQVLNDGTGLLSWQNTLKINLSKNDHLLRTLYLQLLNGKYIFIFRDGLYKYWLLGKNYGTQVTESEVTPGRTFGDFNGNKLTFTNLDYEPIYEVLPSAFTVSTTFNNADPDIAIPVPPEGD